MIPILSRSYHSSFSTEDGIVILGGYHSPSTAEYIKDSTSTSLGTYSAGMVAAGTIMAH